MKIMDKLFLRLKNTLSKCIYPAEFYKRPDSVALLNETQRLVFSPNAVINDRNFKQIKDCLEKFEIQFFDKYLTSKLHPFY